MSHRRGAESALKEHLLGALAKGTPSPRFVIPQRASSDEVTAHQTHDIRQETRNESLMAFCATSVGQRMGEWDERICTIKEVADRCQVWHHLDRLQGGNQ